MQEQIARGARITRQSLSNRIIHWLIAFSTVILLFTGFGQMPMYPRYGVSALPGLAWAANYNLTLSFHYAAGAILVFAGVYHLVYHLIRREFDLLPRRGDLKESVQVIGAMCKLCKAPDCHKYLGEQRLAYAFVGLNILLVVITGFIKVYKNLPGVILDQATLVITTNIHNFAAIMLVLGIGGHLIAFAFKENRALLPAMFSGCIDLDYVKERHGHWYNGLCAKPGKIQRSLCFFKRGMARKQKMAS